MPQSYFYEYNAQKYEVIITHKRIKRIIYRFHDDKFFVSAPHFVTWYNIKKGLDKFAQKLVDNTKSNDLSKVRDSVYLFGVEVKINQGGGLINFKNGATLKYLNYEDLIDKLKQVYLEVMTSRTRYFENLMKVSKPYKVKIKKMRTRLGSNSSKTHTIYYADHLFYYSIDILDSLVVHELSHDFVKNHSEDFYKVVYKYCPNYKKVNNKLKKGIYF